MEIFLNNLPSRCTEPRLRKELRNPLRELGIRAFDVFIFRKGGIGTLTVPTEKLGAVVLHKYGTLPITRRIPSTQGRATLMINGRPIRCQPSKKAPDKHVVKSLCETQARILAEESRPTISHPLSSLRKRKFDVNGVECGVWRFHEGGAPVFNSYYKLERSGQMILGRDGVRVIIFEQPEPGASGLEQEKGYMIFFPYHSVESIIVGGQPQVTFTLCRTPMLYYRNTGGLISLLIDEEAQRRTLQRVSSLDQDHSVFAAFCFVYRFLLRSPGAMHDLQRLGMHKGVPAIDSIYTNYVFGPQQFLNSFMNILRRIPSYNFKVAFQLTALLANGGMPPELLLNLLPDIDSLISRYGDQDSAGILREFASSLPKQNPLDKKSGLTERQLQGDLEEHAQRFKRLKANHFVMRSALEDDGKLAFVHHALITPAGCYFEGPKPETQNRVLRRYADYHDYFLRVTFIEEDGDSFSYERDVSQDFIYERFKGHMIESRGGKLIIGGRVFSFLGFSGASLRNHTCWFMAPFYCEGEKIDSTALIAKLGDFSHITTPGKCAARIGQAFSNTFSSVHVPKESEVRIPDVERDGRCFSDGCGTISKEMMERIWQLDPAIARSHPFVFQIRFAGAKGVLSLDTRLEGDMLCLRPSMVKFEGSDARNIEICSTASKPLPMYLNRPLIKILEDLGVEDKTFLSLQAEEVEKLRDASHTPALAANFMERRSIGIKSLKLPWLIKALYSLDLSFQNDIFLGQAFELALLTALRDIKYRARIQIPRGFTVMGLMDETGELEEGEIFCHIDDGGKRSILTGEIVITRAPAMHPGDVQICRAVTVTAGSPLHALRNCVVFSQKGTRDLPSQLGGGDLDGDLYNLIFDPRFRPKRVSEAANYPRVKGRELGRPVNTEDMVDFLLDFMQNDRLGLISHRHLIIADQHPEGVFHPDCLTLAEMHSTAVDFPKSGIKVDLQNLPKCGRSRPDFMAPGPQVLVDKSMTRYEEERDPRDEEEDDDEFGNLPMRYYESEKILGKLYRKIDERSFIQDIQPENTRNINLLLDVWDYCVGFVTDKNYPLDLPWRGYSDFAENLKASYEDSVRSLMRDYSITVTGDPLKEVEVFIGCIVGKGKQNKREKDSSVAMKEGFDRIVDETFEQIRGSQDDKYSSLDILARGMACLWACISVSEDTPRWRYGGEKLKSFGWVAASATLQQVDELQSRRKSETRRMRQRNGLPVSTGNNALLGMTMSGLRR